MWCQYECVQQCVLCVRISDPVESSDDLHSRAWTSIRPLYAATETLILPSVSQGTVCEAELAPVQDRCHDCTVLRVSAGQLKSTAEQICSCIETDNLFIYFPLRLLCRYFCSNDSLLLCLRWNTGKKIQGLAMISVRLYVCIAPLTHTFICFTKRKPHTPTWSDRMHASCGAFRSSASSFCTVDWSLAQFKTMNFLPIKPIRFK